jgi:RNA polymerase sigma-70 factor (ECF subfamily)
MRVLDNLPGVCHDGAITHPVSVINKQFLLSPRDRHDIESIALLFQQGEESALSFFYEEFFPALTLFASRWVRSREIAEEIASEAFIKTWKMHHKLGSFAAIRAYLYRTVCRDSLRAEKREQRRERLHNLVGADVILLDTPFQHLVRSEAYRQVHAAIRELSPGYRKIITMHFLEGKSTGEIARELNAPVNTIKAQKLKGLKALRKKLIKPLLFFSYLITDFSSLFQ